MTTPFWPRKNLSGRNGRTGLRGVGPTVQDLWKFSKPWDEEQEGRIMSRRIGKEIRRELLVFDGSPQKWNGQS